MENFFIVTEYGAIDKKKGSKKQDEEILKYEMRK